MDPCLTCLRPAPAGTRHHPRCSRRLFGSDVAPRIDLSVAQFQTVALATVGRSSLAGVQRKISVGLLKDRTSLRIETDGGGRFILKPPSPTLEQMPENEQVSMSLARLFGLRVPDHTLVEMADGSLAYVVVRFDRLSGGGKLRQEDFCQLRLLPPSAKYDASAADCAETLRTYSSEPAADLIALFETFVFAYWIGNGDHHLKNMSLLADAAGRHLLSPVYDQVCTAVYPEFDPRPALPLVAGVKHVRPTDWLAFARDCELTPRAARRILTRPGQRYADAVALVTGSHLRGRVLEAYLRGLGHRTADLEAAASEAARGLP